MDILYKLKIYKFLAEWNKLGRKIARRKVKRPIEYPELERIARTYQNYRLLGRELVWEAKEDGSNIMLWWDNKGKFRISSRHMNEAQEDMKRSFNSTTEAENVKSLIEAYEGRYVVFGELLQKGIIPTRLLNHPDNKFVLFDIYDQKSKTWLNYVAKSQMCYHFKIPIVEALATCKVTSMESLLEFSEKVMEIAKSKGRYEGTVLKTQYNDGDTVFAKEKFDTPKMEKLLRVEEEGKVKLPPLPESEVWGAVDKAYQDLGKEAFLSKKDAMPLIVKYIKEEATKHNCAMPKEIYNTYYVKKCGDMEVNKIE